MEQNHYGAQNTRLHTPSLNNMRGNELVMVSNKKKFFFKKKEDHVSIK